MKINLVSIDFVFVFTPSPSKGELFVEKVKNFEHTPLIFGRYLDEIA